jgi:hypothetical protein
VFIADEPPGKARSVVTGGHRDPTPEGRRERGPRPKPRQGASDGTEIGKRRPGFKGTAQAGKRLV